MGVRRFCDGPRLFSDMQASVSICVKTALGRLPHSQLHVNNDFRIVRSLSGRNRVLDALQQRGNSGLGVCLAAEPLLLGMLNPALVGLSSHLRYHIS